MPPFSPLALLLSRFDAVFVQREQPCARASETVAKSPIQNKAMNNDLLIMNVKLGLPINIAKIFTD
jgi:DNA replicative helicase MCM subunit Mcm2 (Cdc46/Mcm family)